MDGSLREVASIESLYRGLFDVRRGDVKRLSQQHATEAQFRESGPNYEILHLATHGYFADAEYRSRPTEQEREKQTKRELILGRSTQFQANTYDPGILSGLVLASANNIDQATDSDDGIMTAQEISYLQLRGTKLVTLSACETGLGKVAGGEGLIGIQRAFQIAGAKTVIATSWKVDDIVTRKLMERFYRNYFEKEMGKQEALREAQLWILNNPNETQRPIDKKNVLVANADGTRGAIRKKKPFVTNSADQEFTQNSRTHPYFWAPFILSGDWR